MLRDFLFLCLVPTGIEPATQGFFSTILRPHYQLIRSKNLQKGQKPHKSVHQKVYTTLLIDLSYS